MGSSPTYIDLFSGAGGLSEGFIRSGFLPIAHVEMNKNSSNTLKTRLAYHYLNRNGNTNIYRKFLLKKITSEELWQIIPPKVLDSVINQEITEYSMKDIFTKIDTERESHKVDVIIGGPPCQAYSLVGRSRDPNRMREDARNYLFRYYAQFLARYKPKYFVFENVLGLLSAGSSFYLNNMLKLFYDVGYSTDFKILNAANFGVLQNRKRVIIIGKRGLKEFTFPHFEEVENKWQIKKDLFYDLPPLSPGEELEIAYYHKGINPYLKKTGIRNGFSFTTQHIARQHNTRDLEIYAIVIKKWLNERKRIKYSELPKRLQTHNKKDIFLDRFKVVDPIGNSHTLVAHIAKDGHYYIYPDFNQIRSISVREAARIQSFPDNYYFEGGRTSAFSQIGNAVPPLMAQAIAKTIYKII